MISSVWDCQERGKGEKKKSVWASQDGGMETEKETLLSELAVIILNG